MERLSANEEGKRRFAAGEGGPLLLNDWLRAVFIHFRVPPAALQPHVPFELDPMLGDAFVSLVAFEIEGLRPARGPRILRRLLSPPVSGHGFLNVRTYVRSDGEPGICFLREWLDNRLSVLLGPPLFGLPYHHGSLSYRHDPGEGELCGEVRDPLAAGAVRWHFALDPSVELRPCEPDSFDAFVMERYSAFTERLGVCRRFRVWHQPWPQTSIEVVLDDTSLLEATCPWFEAAEFVSANYSPGVESVWIGRPRKLGRESRATLTEPSKAVKGQC